MRRRRRRQRLPEGQEAAAGKVRKVGKKLLGRFVFFVFFVFFLFLFVALVSKPFSKFWGKPFILQGFGFDQDFFLMSCPLAFSLFFSLFFCVFLCSGVFGFFGQTLYFAVFLLCLGFLFESCFRGFWWFFGVAIWPGASIMDRRLWIKLCQLTSCLFTRSAVV